MTPKQSLQHQTDAAQRTHARFEQHSVAAFRQVLAEMPAILAAVPERLLELEEPVLTQQEAVAKAVELYNAVAHLTQAALALAAHCPGLHVLDRQLRPQEIN